MDDEALGRIAFDASRDVMWPGYEWEELNPGTRDSYIAAARAVRDAVLPPGSVALDREIVRMARNFVDDAGDGWAEFGFDSAAEHERFSDERTVLAALTAALEEGNGGN